jgi:hypothetical protein
MAVDNRTVVERPWLRASYILVAGLLCVLGLGLLTGQRWATGVWPLPAGRLSYVFLASVLAAVAAPMVWVALAEEWGAGAGSALFPLILSGALAVHFVRLAGPTAPGALPVGVVCAVAAIASLLIHVWSRRVPLRDRRPTPRPVQWSFAVFVVVLVLSGGALVLARPNIMPWPVRPEASVAFGWVFLGASSAYAYALAHSGWHHARGPLLGFLAYDLVLLPPLLRQFSTVRPELHLSLVIYTAVLVFSALLGIYYLLLNRETRAW